MIRLMVTADIVVEECTGETMHILVKEELGKSIMEDLRLEEEVTTSEIFGRHVFLVIERKGI